MNGRGRIGTQIVGSGTGVLTTVLNSLLKQRWVRLSHWFNPPTPSPGAHSLFRNRDIRPVSRSLQDGLLTAITGLWTECCEDREEIINAKGVVKGFKKIYSSIRTGVLAVWFHLAQYCTNINAKNNCVAWVNELMNEVTNFSWQWKIRRKLGDKEEEEECIQPGRLKK